jgi:hypothetical protein
LADSTPGEIFTKFVENRSEEFTKGLASRAKSMHPISPSSSSSSSSSSLPRRGSGEKHSFIFNGSAIKCKLESVWDRIMLAGIFEVGTTHFQRPEGPSFRASSFFDCLAFFLSLIHSWISAVDSSHLQQHGIRSSILDDEQPLRRGSAYHHRAD